jgi:murein DD-endopeptidase MepM/ murein hydrolase activator NlpD
MVSLFGMDLDGAFGAIKGATKDLFGSLDLTGPQRQAALGGDDPFKGLSFGNPDPFRGLSYGNGAFDSLQLGSDPFAGLGGRLGGVDPNTGASSLAGYGYNPIFAKFDVAQNKVAAKAQADEQAKQARDQANINSAVAYGGGPSGGLEPGVAQWSDLTNKTFAGTGVDPDTMLAIMTNESHGNPRAYNKSGASGLFQLMPGVWGSGEDPFSPTDQMAAARRLALEKLAAIDAAYAANGLNPDARTRALDFALAWAGHFDYNTGRMDPNSRDNWVGGQTSQQFAAIFLGNYDKIKAGRQQAQPGYSGAGGMASIWGGGNGPITQGYGVVTPGIDQGIYGYGADYGLPQGHTGDDIGLPRGTKLYMPAGLTGVVTTAGGTRYFRDEDYGDMGTPGKGELRITLSNGDILILGHTSQIAVQVGQQLSGGAFVGLSGSASGDHLHLEVRRRNPDGSYSLVDPQVYFSAPTGGGGAGRY